MSATDETRTVIRRLLESASPETAKLIPKVIEIEREKLHLSQPTGMDRQIATVIKELVQK